MVDTFRVAVPPVFTEPGSTVAVGPPGDTDADRLTCCALPLVSAVRIVAVAESPALTVPLDGSTDTEKSSLPSPCTVRVKAAVCVADSRCR